MISADVKAKPAVAIDSATKLLLVETAERLFAEHGLEQVSLRQIAAAAGQRNTAAAHYHFGTREALIEAIFALRMSRINERRLQMLADLTARELDADLRAIVAARVNPLAERLIEADGNDYYVRFLAQAGLSPQVDVAGLIRGRYDEGLIRSSHLIQRILAPLPKRILNQRITVSATSMVYALAELQPSIAGRRQRTWKRDLADFVENLIDMITGALSAPVAVTRTDSGRK